MSDRPDPRLDVMRDEPVIERSLIHPPRLLADLDAADRAAGIVRVDTRDEALVERLEPVVYYQRYGWNASHGGVMEEVRRESSANIVRAVLAALREAP